MVHGVSGAAQRQTVNSRQDGAPSTTCVHVQSPRRGKYAATLSFGARRTARRKASFRLSSPSWAAARSGIERRSGRMGKIRGMKGLRVGAVNARAGRTNSLQQPREVRL